jgi:heme oxygenase-like protein
MKLPSPRGPLSGWVIGRLSETGGASELPDRVTDDPMTGDDLHLALSVCYELHYGGIEDVDPAWEWSPELLGFRSSLERPFEAAMREAVSDRIAWVLPSATIDVTLRRVIRADRGPSLSAFLEEEGTVEQFREFLIQRSPYQLREADPHTFGIPRLAGRAKAALVEIQADEYGGGDPRWMHSSLFAGAMRALDLDVTAGTYLDLLPGSTLAWVNLMSLVGLHRRLRGALVGHLAAFEMTSCAPNRRYGNGLRRLGFGPEATAYFDEHVEADAVHEAIAATDLAGSLVEAEPDLRADVVFGAGALLETEARFAEHVLAAWRTGRSSLRDRPAALAG